MKPDEWDRRFAELESGVTDLERKIEAMTVSDLKADVWDEACQAFAWAMKEDPTAVPVSWLSYVHEHNPYRLSPTGDGQ